MSMSGASKESLANLHTPMLYINGGVAELAAQGQGRRLRALPQRRVRQGPLPRLDLRPQELVAGPRALSSRDRQTADQQHIKYNDYPYSEGVVVIFILLNDNNLLATIIPPDREQKQGHEGTGRGWCHWRTDPALSVSHC